MILANKNKTLLFSSFVLGLGLLIGCAHGFSSAFGGRTPQSAVLRIGVQPNESAKDLSQLQVELTKRMGRSVEFYKPSDYSQLVNEFKKGTIDFAFMTGLVFIEAEREANAKALLKKVYGKNEFYYSAILVNSQSKIKKVKDLKGKRFGFVDVKSTSGYLYPRVILRKNGLDAGEGLAPGENILSSSFFGTHEKTLRALVDEKIDAIGVWADEPTLKTGAWTEPPFAQDKKVKFRVLDYSDPIPNDVFVVREQYFKENPMLTLKFMETLIGLSEEPNNSLKKVFNVDRLTTATSRHYDGVRALGELLKEGKK